MKKSVFKRLTILKENKMSPRNTVATPFSKRGNIYTPKLKNALHSERAINLLFEYENTGLTPVQICDLQETIYNLQQRIISMEDW